MKSAKLPNIGIIDYGMGNVKSVQNAIIRLGSSAFISRNVSELEKADALVLPGVGAFGVAMDNLRERNLIKPLTELSVSQKKPLLGICLGMQLFATHSEELGEHEGLNWVPGKIALIDSQNHTLQIPQVGWNNVLLGKKDALFSRVDSGNHFYFDHSYHFVTPEENVIARVNYGSEIVAAVRRGNIFGVQFHPEKSQSAGLKLLRGFLNFVGNLEC